MTVQLWQAAAIIVAAGLGGGLWRLLTVPARNRRTDAVTMTRAYGHVIDRLEETVDRQGKEIAGLRDHVTELLRLIGARDSEIAMLRHENDTLRDRIVVLEAKVGRRRDD